MDTLPPSPVAPPAALPPGAQDADHLRLLSIFHYVVGGIIALFSLLPVIHLVLGLAMVGGYLPVDARDGSDPVDPRLFGWIFVAVAACFIVGGLTLAGFIAYAGRCLAQRRRYLLCMIVAGISCCLMPFGTVLGVFTLVVLLRPTVKQAFATPAAGTRAG